jgi:hypothetical protein
MRESRMRIHKRTTPSKDQIVDNMWSSLFDFNTIAALFSDLILKSFSKATQSSLKDAIGALGHNLQLFRNRLRGVRRVSREGVEGCQAQQDSTAAWLNSALPTKQHSLPDKTQEKAKVHKHGSGESTRPESLPVLTRYPAQALRERSRHRCIVLSQDSVEPQQ